MNQKQLGVLLIVIGIVFAFIILVFKMQQDAFAMQMIHDTGTCFTNEGVCLHQRNMTLYVVGWALSSALALVGVYLLFFDKTQERLVEQNIRIARALKEAKKEDAKKSSFEAFLSAFPQDERAILRIIHDQEGIKQSTLRFKLGMSKSSLSLLLSSLEERELISRNEVGKTKEIYLRKKF